MSTHGEDEPKDPVDPLVSELAADPDMIDLIDYFVDELQQGVQRLCEAWHSNNTAVLRQLSHQIKGAAGGYGFPSITSSAAEFEALLLAGESETSAINEKFEQLISLCRRATGPTRDAADGSGATRSENPRPTSEFP